MDKGTPISHGLGVPAELPGPRKDRRIKQNQVQGGSQSTAADQTVSGSHSFLGIREVADHTSAKVRVSPRGPEPSVHTDVTQWQLRQGTPSAGS
eukprot:3644042-Amphidinium_carterae.1